MSFHWARSDHSVGEGFLRIAREQIGKAVAVAQDESLPPEKRIHEVRRRCKKLRALFRLVRSGFADYDAENAFVRDAARSLAVARDERVLQRTLEALMRWAGKPLPEQAVERDPDTAAETRMLAEFAAAMSQLFERAGEWACHRIDVQSLVEGLQRTYGKAYRLRRRAIRRGTEEAMHEWRKYAKYYWNQLGLLEDAAPDIVPSEHKAAGELATLLGLHHDVALLAERLKRDPAGFGPELDVPLARDAAERRLAELERQIEALGHQVFAEQPRALRDRFAAYLDDWHVRRETA